MFRYLRHSDIALRFSLNPFNWVWLPSYAHDKPSPFFPKRHTFVLAWLGVQVFLDIDNGVTDFKAFQNAALKALDMEIEIDESELGQEVSTPSKRSSYVE